MKEILLITPPFTQLNTPYPATAYLKGFLNAKNIGSYQVDLGIEVILEVFSKEGLTRLFKTAKELNNIQSANSKRIFALQKLYINTVEPVIKLLQGHNSSLARLMYNSCFLPQASRFSQLIDAEWAFGTMGIQDKAKHLATLYLEDLSDFITECIDENFGFSRYAEQLGRSANSFDDLYAKMQNETSYIDKICLKLLDYKIKLLKPKLICFSVPFPGNLYSAFRCAQYIKGINPQIKIALGGGFANTELRSISDTRVFDFFDFITLDDGELPLELIYTYITDLNNAVDYNFKRTFIRENNKVVFNNSSNLNDYTITEKGTPDYTDLLLDHYMHVIEITNPMHSIWTDGRWNKLTMTHGCYWAKCTFCDVTLDYIKNFDPLSAKVLVDQMEQLIEQTGEHGFHFVDEAANPSIMKALALEIIKRNLTVTWWTNIRFEKSFTPDLCQLLKASGCIAVSGGLEVASDRLLGLINKGVTVEQVARVTNNFTKAGIMVHAYLMYGFPTQTVQETIDSLEMVRQLFALGIIQSGFWHHFALTAHSPIGQNPEKYDIIPRYNKITFANNDIHFTDKTGIDHDKFSFGLKKSLYNYMQQQCFDYPLQDWFDFKIPKTSINPNFIEQCLKSRTEFNTKDSARIIWLATLPVISLLTKTRKGKSWDLVELLFHTKNETIKISLDKEPGLWFAEMLKKLSVENVEPINFGQLKASYENLFENFELFWYSKPISKLKNNGLIAI